MLQPELKNLKVGDKVYHQSNMGGWTIATITTVGKARFKIAWGDKATALINMDNGYEVGSRGEGRYGYFQTRHWYPLTDEKKLEFAKKRLAYNFARLDFEKLPANIASRKEFEMVKVLYERISLWLEPKDVASSDGKEDKDAEQAEAAEAAENEANHANDEDESLPDISIP